jgi:hypothetical protein
LYAFIRRTILINSSLFSLSLLILVACNQEGGFQSRSEISAPPSSPLQDARTLNSPTPAATPRLLIPLVPGTETAAPQVTQVAVESTPEPSPSASIPGLIGPSSYPADVNPLTGLVVDDPEILNRRPLAIKISNIARVRPQSGLNKADLVFEHYTEGGITRFTALYWTHDSKQIGSIRSGRLIDLEIPVMYDAAFGYSGSSSPLRSMFEASSFFERIVSPDFAHSGYYRLSDPTKTKEFLEDTMFTDTYRLREILKERGQENKPEYENGMAFHPIPPSGGTPAIEIEVNYSATSAFWFYDIGLGNYFRWSDGIPHLDASTDQPLTFDNILVLSAKHVNTEIIEDSGGSPSIQIQLWGEGPVSVFRDGQRFDGIWKRQEPEDMLTFYDLQGNIIPLAPGKSFIEVIPLDFKGFHVYS